MVGEEVLVEVMVHLILHVRHHILCLSQQVVNLSLSLSAKENCNTGCLGNWLGDRYCDQVCILSLTCNIIFHSVILSCQACRVPDCGYDAGDCGTELWDTLYSVIPQPNHTHLIPLGTTAMFFNLTQYFNNGSISSAYHTPCPVIRTAVLAQTFKTLSLTFARNTSHCIANITINGTSTTGSIVTVRILPHQCLITGATPSIDYIWYIS